MCIRDSIRKKQEKNIRNSWEKGGSKQLSSIATSKAQVCRKYVNLAFLLALLSQVKTENNKKASWETR